MSPQNRLLPEELYPVNAATEAERDVLDEKVRQFSRYIAVPTMPGDYGDKDGDLWTLDDEGFWTDKFGESQPRSWHAVLPLMGPFRRLGTVERRVKRYQRQRHLAHSRAAASAEDRLFGGDTATSH